MEDDVANPAKTYTLTLSERERDILMLVLRVDPGPLGVERKDHAAMRAILKRLMAQNEEGKT